MISLFCSDFDNTLARHSRISDRNIEAINLLNEKGIKFALVTGRPLANAKRLLANHSLKANIVSTNGSSIGLLDGRSFSTLIAPQALLRLLKLSNSRKYFFICYGLDFCALPSWLPFFERGLISKIIEKHSSMKVRKLSSKNFKDFCQNEEIVKISIYPIFSSAKKLWQELDSDKDLYITSASTRKLEISASGVSKWKGILKLAEELSVKKDEIASIGDFLNDISMLKAAKYSFAMGDAPEKVKRAAKEVVGDVKNDGFAMAVQRLLEMQELKENN